MIAAFGRYLFKIVIFIVFFGTVFSWSGDRIFLNRGYANAQTLSPKAAFLNTPLLAAFQIPQFEERPATLVGPRENSAIALYIRPAPNQQPVGYGMDGDAVTVTDQFGDYLMEDDPSATWSHIRLEQPPYIEGWLRGRFLSMQPVDETGSE